ncbi:MAG: ATP synthase F1 subunit gamma [Xanthomonadaceae bacterium]|nr:ATP synthase F1 subunit gamma [Xanthomonadaceae bacterium]
MASTRDLKKRITTVKTTQQTTRAMKLVSASKLRRAQEAITAQRPYAKQISRLIRVLAKDPGVVEKAALLRINPIKADQKPNVLVVGMSSDRGLCGSFNSNVIKTTQRWIVANRSKYSNIEVITVGRRINEIFKSRVSKDYKVVHAEEFGSKIQIGRAKGLSEILIDAFVSGRVDEVVVIYNEFKNAISQKLVAETLLPVLSPEVAVGDVTSASPGDYLMKPDAGTLLESLLKKHFVAQVFRMLLESQASEHGARMSSMENATKNAGEMIKKLTLQYNKQRQAGITKELLEIIAGSESQNVEG